VLVGEDAGHDALDVPGHDAGDVGDAFALAQADLRRAEVQRVAAEVLHANLEGDAGAQRRLLEDHAQHLALEYRAVAAALPLPLEEDGQVEHLLQILR